MTDKNNENENRNNDKEEDFFETSVFEKLTDPVQNSRTAEETEQHDSLDATRVKMKPQKLQPKDMEPEESSAGREVLSFFKDLFICMAVVMVITNFIVRPVQVSGNSMYPTLNDKALGFSNLIGNHFSELKRFDIVIIHIPEKNEYIVKRVIGLPGETVSYQGGQLYINGSPIEEDFIDQDYASTYGGSFMSDVQPVELGKDQYYCLGDNRPHSSDSRYYGPFNRQNIVSKGVFIFFPFSEIGVHTW